MFRYIGSEKWVKLQKELEGKNGAERCKERDSSGLSLLSMSFGFGAPLDIIKQILEMDPVQADSRDLYGASPLHIACLNGASKESVLYLLKKHRQLAFTLDKDRRSPLHHSVECLCRDEIDFVPGVQIIKALVEVYPASIHQSDKHRDTPIDLVQLARSDADPDSKEEINRLKKLYLMLTGISVRLYKDNKARCEENGYNIVKCELTKEGVVRSTTSTKSSISAASSFVTTFTNRETVNGMDLSTVGDTDMIAPAKQLDRNLSVAENEDGDGNSKFLPVVKKSSLGKKSKKRNIIKFWKTK